MSLNVATAIVLTLALTGPARASFVSPTVGGPMSVSSATLAAPTGVVAAVTSCVITLGPVTVTVSWTATTSAFADGYEIFRSTAGGGPFSSIGTVSGRTTISFADTGRPFSTTYYYVVQAKKLNWRSGNSTATTITTPNLLCL